MQLMRSLVIKTCNRSHVGLSRAFQPHVAPAETCQPSGLACLLQKPQYRLASSTTTIDVPPLYVQGQTPGKALDPGLYMRKRSREAMLKVMRQFEPKVSIREYFYFIDHQGQVFMDDSMIKNFTTCFKDKKFLDFFLRRVQPNNGERYAETFPFLSMCGRECNYIRCNDVPIVFTHLLLAEGSAEESRSASDAGDCNSVSSTAGKTADEAGRSDETKRKRTRTASPSVDRLVVGNCGESFTVPFEPSMVAMETASGRVYHPAPEKHGGVGLIKSSLAIELSKNFLYRGVSDNTESMVEDTETCSDAGGETIRLPVPTHFRWRDVEHKLSGSVVRILERLVRQGRRMSPEKLEECYEH